MGTGPSSTDTSRRILARAAAELGGVERLAERLKVSPRVVQHCLTGHEPIPDALLLKAMDIILESLPSKTPAKGPTASARDS